MGASKSKIILRRSKNLPTPKNVAAQLGHMDRNHKVITELRFYPPVPAETQNERSHTPSVKVDQN